MKRTKILILTHSLNIGGAEKHIYDLVSYMDDRKFSFVIICLYKLGAIGEMILKENKDIIIYHDLMKNKFDILGIFKFLRISMSEKIDIIFIVHTPLTLFWGMLYAKLNNIRKSITRFTTTFPSLRFKRRKIINYLVLALVDKIIAQASFHKEYLINNEGADPNKVVVIQNGVNVESFSQTFDNSHLRQSLCIPEGVPVVGIVAQLRPEKGHEIFLKAGRSLIDEVPETHFLLVGDGAERKKLEALSEELGLQSYVHFLGMRKDIAQIISVFDVAVLASSPNVETFSNAILEYMAASKPVVATDVGSIAEQVIDQKTGYLVPYEDPDALSEAILKLLKNKDIAVRMAKAGREVVEEKFTVQKMIKKYESVFEDLIVQGD